MRECRPLSYALVITFLTGLILPLLFVHNQRWSTVEKRRLALFPSIERDREALSKLPSGFEAFYNDHFGFREELVYWHNVLGVKLGMSPAKTVIVGRDGWLFGNHPSALADYRGIGRFTASELQQWQLYLESKYLWLQEQGVHYVFVVAPNKKRIYGEYMPSRIRKITDTSRCEQLLRHMRTESEVPIVDLRSVLHDAKKIGQLYGRTDTHWNDLGANIAQYHIAEYLARELPNIEPNLYGLEDFELTQTQGGDLALAMNLADELRERVPVLTASMDTCSVHELDRTPYGLREGRPPQFYTECPNAKKVDALVFRDSFFEILWPYMSRYFREATYVWCVRPGETLPIVPPWPAFEQLVEDMSPDVVIEERVDHFLERSPSPPEPACKSYETYLAVLSRLKGGIPPPPETLHKTYQAYLTLLFRKGEKVYSLLDSDDGNALHALYEVGISRAEGGYSILSTGSDPRLLLPAFAVRPTSEYLVKLDLVAPTDTKVQVFYLTKKGEIYSGDRSHSVPLSEGENTIYVRFDDQRLYGRLRLDPGTLPGKYLLKDMEVREAANEAGLIPEEAR